MWTCKHCNGKFSFTTIAGPGSHTRWCDENPLSKQKIIQRKHTACSRCGVQYCLLDAHDRGRTCSRDCQYIKSDHTRKLISEKRRQYLGTYPEAHPWKRHSKNISKPCENVKRVLEANNIYFVAEYSPSKERHFSIDIAFPDIKVGIEVNGNQHYNSDGTLKEYYQKRHEFLNGLGWKIVEVHYSKCFNDANIAAILDFDLISKSALDIDTVEKYLKPKIIRGQHAAARTARHQSLCDKWERTKDCIFEHDIDFSKFGWVGKVATILGIPSQKVNRWMKKYQPVFYNTTCFKRLNR